MGGTLRLNHGKKNILAAIGSNIFKVASMLLAVPLLTSSPRSSWIFSVVRWGAGAARGSMHALKLGIPEAPFRQEPWKTRFERSTS
jgi:hypothetical protein